MCSLQEFGFINFFMSVLLWYKYLNLPQMKKLFYFLVFLFIGAYCYSQEKEVLPEKPWGEIVEMKMSGHRGLRRWSDDVKVELQGYYTKNDSIKIGEMLKKLDSVTETISIGFSNSKGSNLQIKFSKFYRKTNVNFDFRSEVNFDKSGIQGQVIPQDIAEAYIFIQKTKKEDEIAYNYLEITLARLLFVGSFKSPHEDSGFDLFNRYRKGDKDKCYLTENDLKIVEEIYKKGFEEKFVIAEKQYKNEVLDKVEGYKVLNRDRNLWWVKNPIAVILLPVLILVLIALFFMNKVNKLISIKIKDEILKFTLVGLVLLLFADTIIIFSVSFYDFLTTPHSFGFSTIRYDTVITTIVLSLIAFPFLYLFRFLEFKIQKSSQNIFVKTGLIFLSTGFLPFLISVIFFSLTMKRNSNLQGGYLTLSNIFLCTMIVALIRALISYFIFKERNLIIENETKLSDLRELNAKAELKSLQSQINPHFLYNSLNSIASLAPIDSAKTQKMAYSLSDLFKYSINRKGKKMSTVKDEIEMVKSYLEIEKIRFGDRLQFDIEADSSIENYEIPLFLIQPLVENAVKHGVSQNEGNGQIVLKIERKENELSISVSDNGPNFPEGLVSGHGLQTVYDLLRLSYGDGASLNWTNTPEKIITITIPEIV